MHSFDHLSDEELLAASSAEPEAFGAFYRRHERAMLLFCLRRTRNAEVAADLAAEIFAAALESARRFRPGPKPPVAWLYGIANNKLAASYNRGRVEEKARRRIQAEPLILDDEALERVEALVDSEQVAATLRELLAQLPADQHDAVRAHVLDQRSYREIATDLETSQAVVRQRVSRGLRALRSTLIKDSA